MKKNPPPRWIEFSSFFREHNSHATRTTTMKMRVDRAVVFIALICISVPTTTTTTTTTRFVRASGVTNLPSNEIFLDSICKCLKEDPKDGDCTSFATSTGYGTMPFWMTRDITNMAYAFDFERLVSSGPMGCNLTEIEALRFNADLKYWDTSHVTNFDFMFRRAKSFDGKGLKFWNVGNAETLRGMFQETAEFDDNIAFWDIRNAIDLSKLFLNAEKFSQPIGFWDVSNVETAFAMFEGARRFNEDISTWNWASIFSGSNPSNSCKKKKKKKKKRMRALLQQQTDNEGEYFLRLCGEEIGLKQMFKNAPRFNGDVSTWKGEATRYEQENMFEGSDSFNAKWKCKTEFDGPTETCKERAETEIREEISEIREFFRST